MIGSSRKPWKGPGDEATYGNIGSNAVPGKEERKEYIYFFKYREFEWQQISPRRKPNAKTEWHNVAQLGNSDLKVVPIFV